MRITLENSKLLLFVKWLEIPKSLLGILQKGFLMGPEQWKRKEHEGFPDPNDIILWCKSFTNI